MSAALKANSSQLPLMSLWIAVTFSAILGGLIGCGSHGSSGLKASKPYMANKNTGHTTKDDRGQEYSYTLAGNPEVYQEMLEAFEGKSPSLARANQSVDVVKEKDGTYKIHLGFGKRYFRLESLEFTGALPQVGNERKARLENPKMVPDNFQSNFYLDIRCRSQNCGLMELHLVENAGRYYKAEAYFIHELKEKTGRLVHSEEGAPELLQELDPNKLKIRQKTLVVVGGPSYSEVEVRQKDNSSPDDPLLKIRTDIVDTQSRPKSIEEVYIDGKKNGVTAALSGNDPASGDLMLQLIDLNDDKRSSLLILESDSDDLAASKSAKEPNTDSPNLEPLPTGSPILDPSGISAEVDAFTDAFETYRNNPEVQKRVRLLLGDKPSRACPGCKILDRGLTKNVLNRLQLVRPQILKAGAEVNKSPELAYTLGIESAFLKNDGFPVEAHGQSTALGPWQILYKTAKGIISRLGLPFKVFPKNNPNSIDARRFVLESSIMGLGYFKSFSMAVQKDPGLSLLSYTLGASGAEKRLRSRHGAYLKNGLTFNDLVKYHSFDDSDVKADYVNSIIALRMIGSNPEAHDIHIEEATEIPAALQGKLEMPKNSVQK